MTKDEVLKLALEALETGGWNKTTAAITAIKKALAQPCPTCEALARTVMMDQTGRGA